MNRHIFYEKNIFFVISRLMIVLFHPDPASERGRQNRLENRTYMRCGTRASCDSATDYNASSTSLSRTVGEVLTQKLSRAQLV